MKCLLIFLMAAILGLMSCEKAAPSPVCIEVNYDVAFLIEAGGIYCFTDSTQLEVVALDNQFCPCNVDCFWEGQMVLNMIWTFASSEVLEYSHQCSAKLQDMNIPLPNGLTVHADEADLLFETDCSNSNPSPDILSTMITVSK